MMTDFPFPPGQPTPPASPLTQPDGTTLAGRFLEQATAAPRLADDGLPDFGVDLAPRRFRINDDVFEAAPRIPAGVGFDFAAGAADLTGNGDPRHRVDVFLRFFESVLLPDSWARFSTRLRDQAAPIDPGQLVSIATWLLGEYGLRPTQPSSASSASSERRDGGISSTATPPSPAPTSDGSPSTGP